MDSRDSRHVDANYSKVFHLLGREARSDQVDAGAEPSVLRAALLKADVSSCLKLSHQPVNVLLRHLVDLLLQGLVDGVQVLQVFIFIRHASSEQCLFVLNFIDQLVIVDLVERVTADLLGTIREYALKLVFVVLADVLTLLEFTGDFKEFLHKFGLRELDFANANLATDLEQLHNVRRISLDRLDAHVIVHPLFHEGGVCEGLALLRDDHGVEADEAGQVEQHVRLIVAQTTNRVLTIVRVREGANGEIWQSIQIEYFLKVADSIGGDVEVAQGLQSIQPYANRLNVVLGQVQFSELVEVGDAVDLLDAVLVKPEFLQVDALVQGANALDFIAT